MAPGHDVTIAMPDVEAAALSHAPIIERAMALTVTNVDEHEFALLAEKELKAMKRAGQELFRDTKAKAHATHAAACAAEAKLIAPIDAALGIIGGKCSTYEEVQRKLAQEKRLQLEAIARKGEAERLAREAATLEESGDAATASEVMHEAVAMESGEAPAPVVHVETGLASVKGSSSRKAWKARVTNKLALIQYVAANPQWMHLVEPNEVGLNGLAKSQQGALNVPGVQAYTDTVRMTRLS
jgi:hypothetical protein